MSQQYVLLRKENDLLDSLIGKSFNEKSKFEAGRILEEIHSKAESRMIGKTALCYVVDNSEIKGVGGSTLMKNKKTGKIVSNLILDNFGEIMNTLHFGNPSSNFNAPVLDVSGVARTLPFYINNNWQDIAFGGADGILTQFGSGTNAPARTDFNIQTAFGTPPESGTITNMTTIPVWNSALGQIKTSGNIIAGGAGTINELVLSSLLQGLGNTQRRIAYYRDIISPGQTFIATQTLALEYTIQL